MWDNGGRNIKLNRAKEIDKSPLNRYSAFNAATQGVRKSSSSLFWFLGYNVDPKWPTVNELGMPDPPWLNVEERIF